MRRIGTNVNSVPQSSGRRACCEASRFDRFQSSECASNQVLSRLMVSCEIFSRSPAAKSAGAEEGGEKVFTDHPHMHHEVFIFFFCRVSLSLFSFGSRVVTHLLVLSSLQAVLTVATAS